MMEVDSTRVQWELNLNRIGGVRGDAKTLVAGGMISRMRKGMGGMISQLYRKRNRLIP